MFPSSAYSPNHLSLMLILNFCRCWKKPRRWRSKEWLWERCCNRTDGRWCHCLLGQLTKAKIYFCSRVKLLCFFKTTVLFLKLSTALSFWPVHCAAPVLWNSLPLTIRTSSSLAIFKKHLKTLLFKKAYNLLEWLWSLMLWIFSF